MKETMRSDQKRLVILTSIIVTTAWFGHGETFTCAQSLQTQTSQKKDGEIRKRKGMMDDECAWDEDDHAGVEDNALLDATW